MNRHHYLAIHTATDPILQPVILRAWLGQVRVWLKESFKKELTRNSLKWFLHTIVATD